MAELEFQFPSNGKVVPNENHGNIAQIETRKVSIPFKRESNSELKGSARTKEAQEGFNSLQTGK